VGVSEVDHEVELAPEAFEQLTGTPIAVLMTHIFEGEVTAGESVRIVCSDGRSALAEVQAIGAIVQIVQRVNPSPPPPV
jgi:hypothetical protein